MNLPAAQSSYETDTKLSEIASDLGVGRQRLASLLRDRGVRLRHRPPSQSEMNEMVRRCAPSESLERMGFHLGLLLEWSEAGRHREQRRSAALMGANANAHRLWPISDETDSRSFSRRRS